MQIVVALNPIPHGLKLTYHQSINGIVRQFLALYLHQKQDILHQLNGIKGRVAFVLQMTVVHSVVNIAPMLF
ncbi:hypothetical protein K502DRAFT_324582 [Neoconidiobolus thromboides FSU 785]|nr:hypothetical protein K502DRAFT_324582 [Neoconidiobolus thromboides FSU 785]